MEAENKNNTKWEATNKIKCALTMNEKSFFFRYQQRTKEKNDLLILPICYFFFCFQFLDIYMFRKKFLWITFFVDGTLLSIALLAFLLWKSEFATPKKKTREGTSLQKKRKKWLHVYADVSFLENKKTCFPLFSSLFGKTVIVAPFQYEWTLFWFAAVYFWLLKMSREGPVQKDI